MKEENVTTDSLRFDSGKWLDMAQKAVASTSAEAGTIHALYLPPDAAKSYLTTQSNQVLGVVCHGIEAPFIPQEIPGKPEQRAGRVAFVQQPHPAGGVGLEASLRRAFGGAMREPAGDRAHQHDSDTGRGPALCDDPAMLAGAEARDRFAALQAGEIGLHGFGAGVAFAEVVMASLEEHGVEFEQSFAVGPRAQIGGQLGKLLAVAAESDFVNHAAEAEEVGARCARTFRRQVAYRAHKGLRGGEVGDEADVRELRHAADEDDVRRLGKKYRHWASTGQWKYLEIPMLNASQGMLGRLAARIRAGMGGR